MAHVLVVEDEARMAALIRRELEEQGHEVAVASDGASGLEQAAGGDFELILTDLRMPGMDGLELLRRLRHQGVEAEVVLMTAFASAQTAVEAMKEGAYDYLIKPFEMDELLIMVDRIAEHRNLHLENRQLRTELAGVAGPGPIIGKTPAMREVLALIVKVAPQETTVLVQGESGTGKELVARAVHAASSRTNGPLVAVNCAAIPETLIESELFGHEKGAFTGADSRRLGRFELADGGTLFLDEIGDLALSAQVKLLRVLQDRLVERVGSQRPIPVDVRVIAATNRDLKHMVTEGLFREELYYRLHVFPLYLPPLRERRDDIPLLIRHILDRMRPEAELAVPSLDLLMRYDWPGNIRELENVLERAVILAGDAKRIEPVHLVGLPEADAGEPGGPGSRPVHIPPQGVDLEELEKQHILAALKRTEGNKSEAARLLHMSRRRLYSRLTHHRIEGEGG
jgi:two-component system, NtrC family, response regulator AtoC